MLPTAGDDSCLERPPTRHVDYLSHTWQEEDVHSSWRYVVSKQDSYDCAPRLENAAWRSWAKIRFGLGTVTPESLNWFKDADVTWLYGPLHVENGRDSSYPYPSPPSPVSNSTSTSSLIDKKPILKKRTISQSILQRSLPTHATLRLADAILDSQAPTLARYSSDFDGTSSRSESSCSSPPVSSCGDYPVVSKRHISFNNEVAQCVAVDGKDEYDFDYGFDRRDYGFYNVYERGYGAFELDEPSDDDVVMINDNSQTKSFSSQSTAPRSSVTTESRTIAHLPSTTLKYRCDTPEPVIDSEGDRSSGFFSAFMSRSASTETLRPSKTSSDTDFCLDDECEADESSTGWDMKWNIKRPEPAKPTSSPIPIPQSEWFPNSNDGHDDQKESDLSSSAVFLPFGYDEADEDTSQWRDENGNENRGLIDKVMDTVNTAKDIAHVIWNVGWLG
ncbi:hypothetical protein FQN57_001131 [Myotisia sp. PD_48]|nr:hypothetical protein FQN57_001131 [Myotisia sp. PD_48]